MYSDVATFVQSIYPALKSKYPNITNIVYFCDMLEMKNHDERLKHLCMLYNNFKQTY